MRHPASLNLCALLCLSIAMTISIRASQDTALPSSEPLLREDASGEEIYESIFGDSVETPTTGLLMATHYLKDNRLLPRGFDKTSASPDIGVFGEAARDGTFAGGGDSVRYAVPVDVAGPYTVEVELLYQTIGYRWADNLSAYDAPEPKRFVSYFRSIS